MNMPPNSPSPILVLKWNIGQSIPTTIWFGSKSHWTQWKLLLSRRAWDCAINLVMFLARRDFTSNCDKISQDFIGPLWKGTNTTKPCACFVVQTLLRFCNMRTCYVDSPTSKQEIRWRYFVSGASIWFHTSLAEENISPCNNKQNTSEVPVLCMRYNLESW